MFKTAFDIEQQNLEAIKFPTSINAIKERVDSFDPSSYGATRNFLNGNVSYLSPYISRGVISTKVVYQQIRSLDLPWYKAEKFVQELAWRDYWQQVWLAKQEDIFGDLKRSQEGFDHMHMPTAISQASTTIEAVDQGIRELHETGYMHNHMRMYVAATCCNIGRSHWLTPSRWMYYHLLDGDLASNALSWQWVAGSNANKKYIANQENINKYCGSKQENTFLDRTYDQLIQPQAPDELSQFEPLHLNTSLPDTGPAVLDDNRKTAVYTYYNLDPYWMSDQDVQRILLLEPSHFAKYPVSSKCISFALDLARNIPGIQIFVGEFTELNQQVKSDFIHFKEHPTQSHFSGQEHPRDWISSVIGYFTSFFGFWKKAQKDLKW